MKYRAMLLLLLSPLVLMACSVKGPIKYYEGPTRPDDQIAIVTVPAAISMRSIDGKDVKSPSKESGTYDVQLPPGHHLIVFRYYNYWPYGDAGIMIKSKDVGINTTFEAGKHYVISYPVPQRLEEAENFFSDFSATMVDTSSGKKFSSFEVNDQSSLFAQIKGYFSSDSGTNKATATTTADAAPAVAAATMTATAATAASADAAVKEDPVKRLKFWWLMANESERKEFTEWMKNANESFSPATTKQPVTTTPATNATEKTTTSTATPKSTQKEDMQIKP